MVEANKLDWLMETALVLNVVMCSVIFDMLDRGMGSHIYDVPLLVLWPGFMLVSGPMQ